MAEKRHRDKNVRQADRGPVRLPGLPVFLSRLKNFSKNNDR